MGFPVMSEFISPNCCWKNLIWYYTFLIFYDMPHLSTRRGIQPMSCPLLTPWIKENMQTTSCPARHRCGGRAISEMDRLLKIDNCYKINPE
jgi:hypothetical protein